MPKLPMRLRVGLESEKSICGLVSYIYELADLKSEYSLLVGCVIKEFDHFDVFPLVNCSR